MNQAQRFLKLAPACPYPESDNRAYSQIEQDSEIWDDKSNTDYSNVKLWWWQDAFLYLAVEREGATYRVKDIPGLTGYEQIEFEDGSMLHRHFGNFNEYHHDPEHEPARFRDEDCREVRTKGKRRILSEEEQQAVYERLVKEKYGT